MSSKAPLFLVLLFCFCFSTNNNGQQDYFVESITTSQGLSQGTINDILQDKEGFLWLGTKDGLNRYDGHTFKVFTNDVNDPWRISGNFINLLFEDSFGRIWATTQNEGINIYDKITGRFHHIFHDPKNPNSLSDNYVTSIVEDSSGYFIVSIAHKELNMFRLDENFFEDQKPPNVIRIDISSIIFNKKTTEKRIIGLGKDSKGRIWVGSNKGTFRLNPEKLEFSQVLDNYEIGPICSDENGGLWAWGENSPLAYFNGEKANVFIDDKIGAWDLQLDKNNNLWATNPSSVMAFSLKNWQSDKLPAPIENRRIFSWRPPLYGVRSMLIDRSGIVWIGGNGTGLYKINPNRKLFNLSLSGKSIRKIVPKNDAEFFVRTFENKWHNEKGEHLKNNPFWNNENMLISKNGDYFLLSTRPNRIQALQSYYPKRKIV